MNKFVALAVAFATTVALGQGAVAPKAAEALEKAKAAHGGSALENLKSYEETADLSYFDAKGAVAAKLRGVVRMDFAANRARLELYQGDKLVAVQQYDPKGSSAWAPQSGTVKLPKAEAETVRALLYQGVTGLRFGGKDRDSASTQGSKKLLELEGELVALNTKGVKAELLIAPNGVVLAERSDAPQLGSVVSVYSDVREVSGLKLPHASKSYVEAAKNALFAESKTLNVKVNPVFAAKDFEMPK